MGKYTLEACTVAKLPVPGWECFFCNHNVEFHDLFFYVWIVRGDGRIGLIDTGLPPNSADFQRLDASCQSVDPRCAFRDVRPLEQVLRDVCVAPDQISFVAITQPITYHTGGLLESLLPSAEVFIARDGFLEMVLDKPGHPPRDLYFTQSTWNFLRTLLVHDRLHLAEAEMTIVPGITFEPTGGHHPGSAGVRVTTEEGIVGVLETAFLQRNIDEAIPVGVAENVALCRQVIRRYKQACDVVVASHEPRNALRFREGAK